MSAVVNDNGRPSVFVLRGDRAKKVPVRVGKNLGDMVEVMQGLNGGDRIIVSPLDRVRDGMRVSVPEV